MSRRGRVIIGYVNRENAATLNKKVLFFGEGVKDEDGGNVEKREEEGRKNRDNECFLARSFVNGMALPLEARAP